MADHDIVIDIVTHTVTHKTGSRLYHHVDLRPSSFRFVGNETVGWQSNVGKFTIHFVDRSPFENKKVMIHSKPPQGGVHKTADLVVEDDLPPGSNPYHVAIEQGDMIHMSGTCSACYGC